MHFLLTCNKCLGNIEKFKGTERKTKKDLIHEEKEEVRVHAIHPVSVESRSNERGAGLFLETVLGYSHALSHHDYPNWNYAVHVS